MSNINKMLLSGNLTRDMELKHVGEGTALASGTIAVNGWREGDVAFVDLKVWGKAGEVMSQYAGKGVKVFVAGRIEQERWQDKEGKNRSKLVMVVEDFDIASGGDAKPAATNNAAGTPRSVKRATTDDNYGEPVSSADIPF